MCTNLNRVAITLVRYTTFAFCYYPGPPRPLSYVIVHYVRVEYSCSECSSKECMVYFNVIMHGKNSVILSTSKEGSIAMFSIIHIFRV